MKRIPIETFTYFPDCGSEIVLPETAMLVFSVEEDLEAAS